MNQDWVTQSARDFAAKYLAECELMEEGLAVLILVDEILHTDDYPFCSDMSCPCHFDGEAYRDFIVAPIFQQLMTGEEANSLYHGENI